MYDWIELPAGKLRVFNGIKAHWMGMVNLPEGQERSHVSRLLISSSYLHHDEEEKPPAEMAEEVLVWLMRFRFKKEIGQLSEDIRQAQHSGDQQRINELLQRKAELNKHLAAMNDGGG